MKKRLIRQENMLTLSILPEMRLLNRHNLATRLVGFLVDDSPNGFMFLLRGAEVLASLVVIQKQRGEAA
jgi:hypothetical protein